jgi:tRNA1(Val) A37 N6-methylase TrmN6
MSDYLQPSFYRFNEDSLKLVRWVLSQVREARAILDLGAGCGVIGLELAKSLHPEFLHLAELQPEFEIFLKHNLQNFLPSEVAGNFTLSSFGKLQLTEKFDLIAVNPPYFLPGRGEPSENPSKHLCRTFARDNWQELASCLSRHLDVSGSAFLIVRKDPLVQKAMQDAFAKFHLEMRAEEEDQLIFVRAKKIE